MRNWTNVRREKVEQWLEKAKDDLSLGDWVIQIDWEGNPDTAYDGTGEPNAIATMLHHPDSKHATLSISRRFLEFEGSTQRQILTHELVHCHLFGLHAFAENNMKLLSPKGNKPLKKVLIMNLDSQVESVTDALADVLAPLLPEIEI